MKRIFLLIAGLLSVGGAFAQTTVNLSAGTKALNNGAAVSLTSGNFVNNGSYSDTISAGSFNTASGVTFSGSGPTLVWNLNFNTTGSSDMTGAQVSVYHMATVAAGTTVNAGDSNLWLRTDLPGHSNAKFVNNGSFTGTVKGLVTNATATSGCSTFSSTLSMNVSGTQMVYQWQSSPDSISWTNVASGGTSTTYAATVSATIYYRCLLTTANTAFNEATPGVKLTLGVPVVTVPANQVFCNNTPTGLLSFSSTLPSTTYAWTNNNTSIGLGASSSGNIASFTAVNSGTTPATAVITVTPTANTCVGSAQTFTITVNPTPTATPSPVGQAVCNTFSTAQVNFTSNVTGTTFTWANNNTSIGIGASGSGNNIGSFTGTNSGSVASNGTFSVTPTANTCVGVAQVFSVTVNPTPTATPSPVGQSVCNTFLTAQVNFTSNVTGTTFTWANNNTSIGIGATGSGNNIAAFTATNGGTVASNGTFSVTPTANTCVGAAQVFSVTVNPTPTATPSPAGQSVCNTFSTAQVNFTSNVTGATFTWANNNTSIGIGASGSGSNIALFTGTNSGSVASNGTFSVTPTANTCVGAAQVFSVTVNPTPTATPSPAGQSVCNTFFTAPVNFTSNVTGATFTWANNNTSIGIGASGSGSSIASFTGTNSGSVASNGTFSVTPTANTCVGAAQVFSVTVNPTPSITLGANPSVITGTTSTVLPYTATSASPTNYSITYSDAAHTQGFTDASGTLTGGNIPLVVPAAGAIAVYNGTVTVTNSSCTSVSNPFTITILSALSFNGGSPQALTVCENSTATDITSLLAISDGGTGLTETWSVVSDPNNGGSLGGFNTTAISNGGTVTPTGLTYTPAPGFSGSESFTIQVNNGTSTATTTINATVTPIPGTITGTFTICQNTTTTLGNSAGGGTWSSNNLSVATIDPTGILSGVSGGAAIIRYTTGCGTDATQTLSVTPIPGAISGVTTFCKGNITTLSNTASGGTWASDNGSVALVNPTSGVVFGVDGGTANIIYSTGCGTNATQAVTVTPFPGTITGTFTICQNTTTTLGNSTSGGTWSSNNLGVATIDPTGIVSGVGGGTATINYTTGCGIDATQTVSVTPIPGSITGTFTLCQNTTTPLGNTVNGGAWSSDNTSVATVSVTGVVRGVSGGTATIHYSTGCAPDATQLVTVTPIPGTITGITPVCPGTTATLSDPALGGTWSSSNISFATIDPVSGVMGRVTSDPVNIIYTTGCGTNATVAVNVIAPITGPTTALIGGTTNLSDATPGGTWSSSTTAASVTSGVVTGLATGTATISYVIAAGCFSTAPMTVSAPLILCVGQGVTLSDTVAGGTWTSWSNSFATVVINTGVVTGVGAGTVTIEHFAAGGYTRLFTLPVNPLVGIGGVTSVCQGLTTMLTNTTAGGGVWSSGDNTLATVTGSGVVGGGVNSGMVPITFTTPAGCITTTTVTVNPRLPITGTAVLCVGQITHLSDAAAGGTWTSSNNSDATIVVNTGVMSSLAASAPVITYKLPTGCTISATVTINPLSANTGMSGAICQGQQVTLANTTPGGGTWSSGNTSVATVVTGTGAVFGVSTGSTPISFTATTGCIATTTVTVNQSAPITGITSVCVGQTTRLSDAVTGGTWSSSSNSYATVAAGVVGGVAANSPIIRYGLPSGCVSSVTVTVNPLSATSSLSPAICQGLAETFTNATPGGGTWSSNNTSVATVITGTGVVGGASAGSTGISFTSTLGCVSTKTITVNPVATITGVMELCRHLTTQLSNGGIGGGTWSTINGSIAVVGAGTGLVTTIAAGNTGIKYTLSTGCISTVTVTVDPCGKSPDDTTTAVDPVVIVASDIKLFPNPNKGAFFIKGALVPIAIGTGDAEATIEVTDMLGQIVYKKTLQALGGNINEQIQLGNAITNAMYIVSVRSGEENKVFHIVVEK